MLTLLVQDISDHTFHSRHALPPDWPAKTVEAITASFGSLSLLTQQTTDLTQHERHCQYSAIMSALGRLLPEQFVGDHIFRAHEITARGGLSMYDLMEFIFFATSNGLHAATEQHDRQLLHLFKLAGHLPQTARFLVTSAEPTALSLADNIYGASARVRDLQTLKAFLDAGLNPNTYISSYPSQYIGDENCTIMGRAATQRDIEMLRLLRDRDIPVTCQNLRASLMLNPPPPSEFLAELLAGIKIEDIKPSDAQTFQIAIRSMASWGFDTCLVLVFDRFCPYLTRLPSRIAACLLLAATLRKRHRLVRWFLEAVPELVARLMDKNEYAKPCDPLSAAIASGDVQLARLFLEKGVRVREALTKQFQSTRTSLIWAGIAGDVHHAAALGDVEMLSLLRQHGGNLDDGQLLLSMPWDNPRYKIWSTRSGETDLLGRTPLEAAISHDKPKAAMWLVGADVRLSGYELALAIGAGDEGLVKYFLQFIDGLKPELKELALKEAADGRAIGLVKYVYKHHIQTQTAKQVVVRAAISCGRTELVDDILSSEYDSYTLCAEIDNLNGLNSLDTSTLKSLLNGRETTSEADCFEEAAFTTAILLGDVAVVGLLVSYNIRPQKVPVPSFWTAIRIHEYDKTAWSSEQIASSCLFRTSPLGLAMVAKKEAKARLLLQHGFRSCIDCLIWAAAYGDIGSMQEYLGSDMELARNTPGMQVALTSAIYQKQRKAVELLLSSGANIHDLARIRDVHPEGNDHLEYRLGEYIATDVTPLQAAASAGDAELVDFLLSKNADIDAEGGSDNGITALQIAATLGN